MNNFLESSAIIDWDCPAITAKADLLKHESEIETAKACFLYVRDEIRHSWDYQDTVVTLRASDVLAHGTGYCYAKSHLLAALLRANGIPAALCYQRLSLEGNGAPYCLHGLNAVFLQGFGWHRIDARGNKADVNAQFSPPNEQLAFPTQEEGESDIAGYYSSPLNTVIESLSQHSSVQALYENLPDIEQPAL